MSSEPPPLVNCDVYNYKNWNVETGTVATKTWALYNFLSKRVNDSAQGLISFISGIKTNLITTYSGTVLTIGENDNTKSVNLYYPTLANSNPIAGTNNNTLASTSWVNSWFSYVKGLENTWTQLNSYSLGIEVSNIDAYTINDTVNFISDAGARNNVNILNGDYTGTQTKGNLSIMGGACDAGTTNGNVAIQTGSSNGKMTIGNSLSSLDLKAGTMTLYNPLIPSYGYPIASNRIGAIIPYTSYTGGTGSFSTGVTKTYATIPLTVAGVYIVNATASVYWRTGGTISRCKVYIQSVGGINYAISELYNQTAQVDFQQITITTNGIIYNPTSTTFSVLVLTDFTGTAPEATNTNFNFQAIRIA